MPLPEVTHLQALIVKLLIEADKCGRDLRADLREAGCRMSGPAFYELMARIEERGLVRGRYTFKVVDGHTIKERWYHVEKKGLRALNQARDFYLPQGMTLRAATC